MFMDALDSAIAGSCSVEDIVTLLSAKDQRDVESLFEAAREARDRAFGDRVFTYGFVYFSTYCRNSCSFCYYRRQSSSVERYRKTADEVVRLACGLKDAGVDLADLTMGEDPEMCRDGYAPFTDTVRRVRDEAGISIMASPGALPREVMPSLREAGADWLACYQETYNRDLFGRTRLGQDFDNRRNQKIWAHEAGLLAEDGMMVGIGESVRDRAETILEMGRLGCEQIRAMTFVPQEGTPMQGVSPIGSLDELKAIAVMRILFPDRLIPASLDVEGISGLRTRLEAGANVVTSIVPPERNLAGVAQHELDIENGNRSVHHVFEMLDSMGYRNASQAEYRAFLDSRREMLNRGASE